MTQAEIDAGSALVNSATIDTDQTAPQTDDATTTIAQSPALAVDKTSTTTSVTEADQAIPYTFTVTNTGNVTLSAVTVSDPLAPPPSSARPATPTATASSRRPRPGPTAATTPSPRPSIDAGGSLTNTVTVDSAESAPATDSVGIPSRPDRRR